MANTRDEAVQRWNQQAADLLVGRTIEAARYMSDREMQIWGWSKRAIVIELDNGMRLWPAADDEANDAGALYTASHETPILPTIR
jgi:hypothetical protein